LKSKLHLLIPSTFSSTEWELTIARLDWQLKIHAYDILDPKKMSKEYLEFEARVGVAPASSSRGGGITAPPSQRASFPHGYHELVRVTNKPIIRFTLGQTGHVLELAREDIYPTHLLQTSPPKPQSKWTASFYYSQWVNDLGEFAYKKHGEAPSWPQSLSTFFPEPDDGGGADAVDDNGDAVYAAIAAAAAAAKKKPKGPRLFLAEVEQVKNILWDAMESADGDVVTALRRVGTVEQGGQGGGDVPVSVAA
jgi:hypothetical protein